MTTRPDHVPLDRLLVPTDFSERADAALGLGLQLARRLGAEVVLLHVLTPVETEEWSPLLFTPGGGAPRDELGAIVAQLMDEALARHDAEGVAVVRRTMRGNLAAPAIAAAAAETGARLVIMGTHGRRGLRRAVLGSVADEVVRTAPCPVLLAREGALPPQACVIERVLVPVDLSPFSWSVLPWAETLASACGARIDLLHVLDVFPTAGLYGLYYAAAADVTPHVAALAEAEMKTHVAALTAAGFDAAAHVEIGPPADGIVHYARAHDVDVVVVASHGRTGLSRFVLGSVAEKVAHAAPCPVLVVPATAAAPPAGPLQARGEALA